MRRSFVLVTEHRRARCFDNLARRDECFYDEARTRRTASGSARRRPRRDLPVKFLSYCRTVAWSRARWTGRTNERNYRDARRSLTLSLCTLAHLVYILYVHTSGSIAFYYFIAGRITCMLSHGMHIHIILRFMLSHTEWT